MNIPYWRLSGFYFFYFAALGALVPYWGLYLKSLGFSEVEIGELFAVIIATKIIAPNVWGWIADHTGRRMQIVRLASLLSVVCFAGVFLGSGYWWLVVVMAVFSFFWNASLPQFEATTMNHLRELTHRYSSIRLWGSVGFIVAVAGLGLVLEETDISILPIVLLVLFAGIWINSLIVPEQAAGHLTIAHESLREILAKKNVLALLLVCFLVQASHGPYYAFYSIYLEDNGYKRDVIGGLWAVSVLAEIGIFLVMHRLMPKFGPRNLLLTALLLTAVRWLMIAGFIESLTVLLLAQLLHAASFGIIHAVAIHLIHKYFTGRHQGKGQALYSSISFGAGGALGSLYSGYVWDGVGPAGIFYTSSIVIFLAFMVTWKGIRD